MRWGLLIMLVGCGRLAFDPRDDAGGGDGMTSDTPAITGRHWVNRNDGAPGKLLGARVAFHATRHTLILYGGLLDGTMNDRATAAMWELTSTGWKSLCSPCAPGTRSGQGFAYDPRSDRIVMFSGIDATSATLADLWEWDGVAWAQRPQTGVLPGGRENSSMIFDPSRNVLLLIGGRDPTDSDAVFELTNGAWTNAGVAQGPGSVVCRASCVTFDSKRDRVLALRDTPGDGAGNDEVWSTDASAWTRDCTGCSGQPRNYAALVYDPALDTPFVLGGFDPTVPAELGGTVQLTASGGANYSALLGARDSIAVAYDPGRNVIVAYGGNGSSCGGSCAETWEFVPD